MKKVTALFLALALAFSFTACGGASSGQAPSSAAAAPAQQKEDGGSVVIGYASNAADENENSKMQAFRDFVDDWNEEGKSPALEAVVTVADSSIEKQVGDVETMVEMLSLIHI